MINVDKSDIGADLLQSVNDMNVNKRVRTHFPDIIDTHHRMEMSQSEFTALIGVSTRTLLEWDKADGTNRRSQNAAG